MEKLEWLIENAEKNSIPIDQKKRQLQTIQTELNKRSITVKPTDLRQPDIKDVIDQIMSGALVLNTKYTAPKSYKQRKQDRALR